MNLLFVGAKDAVNRIEPIMAQLRASKDHECFTYQQRLKQAKRQRIPTHQALKNMVEAANAIIVFASPEFKSDIHALQLLDLAVAKGNLVPVIPPWKERVTMPINFFSGLLIIATKEDEKELADLILKTIGESDSA